MFLEVINPDFSIICNYVILTRAILALVFSFFANLFLTKRAIVYFNKRGDYQPIREEGPEGHLETKTKTPTMGGLPMTVSILLSLLLFSNVQSYFMVAIIFVIISFAALGLVDDVLKVFYKKSKPFPGSIKLIVQFIIAGIFILYLQYKSLAHDDTRVLIPFIKTTIGLGVLYIPFLLCVLVASTNAVNITDGLDGLGIVPTIIAAIILGGFAITLGNPLLENFRDILVSDGIGELVIVAASIVGAGLAFFYYNRHPAKIFMGDVGSLMLGGVLGAMAVILRCELVYAIIGLLFVIEAASTIIQVVSYKFFGQRRVFKMAPLHHHLEKSGWPERKIVRCMWIFALISGVIAIISVM